MKISNKLSTKDFRELQKVLFEEEKINPLLMFFLRWVMNFLRALAFSLALYIILLKGFSMDNLVIPIAAGILVFILLVLRFPVSYRQKMRKIIDRAYKVENLDTERETEIGHNGIFYIDRGEETAWQWEDVRSWTSDGEKIYLVLNNSRGTVINTEGMDESQKIEFFSYLPQDKKKDIIL